MKPVLDKVSLISAEKVLDLKEKLFGKLCNNKCNGEGYYIENGEIIDCACSKEFQWQVKLVKANIPEKYWDFSFRNLLKKFLEENAIALDIVKKYCDSIEETVKEGLGLFIQGQSGLAKSALSAYILKEAIKKDIQCYSVRMSHLTKLIIESFKDPEKAKLVSWLRDDVQLLLIDEIEKDFKLGEYTSFTGTHVGEFFDDIYNKKKALLVTSNLTKAKLKGIQAENVIDRLEELGDIILVGESYRRQSDTLRRIMEL